MTAITFYSDDKSILQKFLDLALQFNVKTKMQPFEAETSDDDGDNGVPLRVALQMVEGLNLIGQYERGEIELQSFDDLVAELRAEEAKEAIAA
jgi:hypothetical protein